MDPPVGDVTALLRAWSDGDSSARERLLPLIYAELRRRAAARLRRERRGHSWQPTDLVDEAYLRLVDQRHVVWQNRSHFLALASETMRRFLVDRGRGAVAPRDRRGTWCVRRDRRAGLAGRAGVALQRAGGIAWTLSGGSGPRF